MTKGQIVELIQDGLEKRFDSESTNYAAYIELYLGLAINAAVTQAYKEAIQTDSWTPGTFIVPSKIIPSWDKDRRLHYFVLPVKPISLPNDAGIVYIGPESNESDPFVIANQAGASRISDKAKAMFGKVIVRIEGSTVWMELLSATQAKYPVLVKVMANVDQFSDEDEMPIPPGFELYVIDKTLEFFMKKENLPEARLNDDTDSK